MMRVDDLVERIAALQRSDLEAWIREELVVAAAGSRSVALLGHGMRARPTDLHTAL